VTDSSLNQIAAVGVVEHLSDVSSLNRLRMEARKNKKQLVLITYQASKKFRFSLASEN
jgi:hypothetical protein